MQIEATVVATLPLEQGVSKTSGNPWSKGTVIVETGGQYPKKIALTNMKKADELIALPIGSAFTFDIDVESREYQGRWYTSVTTFRWTPVGAQPAQQAPQPQYAPPQQPFQQPQANAYPQPQGDDIPF